ncbi:hypothetical protein AVDCRST_MAG82-2490, partial [uncultured Rubrobacteraceae bacterium]
VDHPRPRPRIPARRRHDRRRRLRRGGDLGARLARGRAGRAGRDRRPRALPRGLRQGAPAPLRRDDRAPGRAPAGGRARGWRRGKTGATHADALAGGGVRDHLRRRGRQTM